MKKSFKRIVSLFICLAMVFCIPAFAAEEDVLDGYDGHDCAEHEVVVEADAFSSEGLPYDVGIAVAATCTSHQPYFADEGSPTTHYSDPHAVLLPNGIQATCYWTWQTRAVYLKCSVCGEPLGVVTVSDPATHTVKH